MSLALHWTGRSELDRVAEIRWRCYSASGGMRSFTRRRSENGCWGDGDVVIATQNGQDVGTATSLAMRLHARGKHVACQGVAWVGTAKSHRRRRAGQQGIASQVMQALQEKARERGEIVSALMPFRASFYEHFGYGIVERQNIWTVPLSLLPEAPPLANWRFGGEKDADRMLACRARQAAAGQCDIETSPALLNEWLANLEPDTQLFIDDRGDHSAAHAWLRESFENERAIVSVTQPAWDNANAFRALLGLLGGLRDQYWAARIVLPIDLPLNWLLGEHQVPHRRVDHASATCAQITRMQLRVIDPVAFMDGQQLSADVNGKAVLAVRTVGSTTHQFELAFDHGRISAKPVSASADVTCDEVTFAALCTGALPADIAARLGLIKVQAPGTLPLLQALASGPAPFSFEYF